MQGGVTRLLKRLDMEQQEFKCTPGNKQEDSYLVKMPYCTRHVNVNPYPANVENMVSF